MVVISPNTSSMPLYLPDYSALKIMVTVIFVYYPIYKSKHILYVAVRCYANLLVSVISVFSVI